MPHLDDVCPLYQPVLECPQAPLPHSQGLLACQAACATCQGHTGWQEGQQVVLRCCLTVRGLVIRVISLQVEWQRQARSTVTDSDLLPANQDVFDRVEVLMAGRRSAGLCSMVSAVLPTCQACQRMSRWPPLEPWRNSDSRVGNFIYLYSADVIVRGLQADDLLLVVARARNFTTLPFTVPHSLQAHVQYQLAWRAAGGHSQHMLHYR